MELSFEGAGDLRQHVADKDGYQLFMVRPSAIGVFAPASRRVAGAGTTNLRKAIKGITLSGSPAKIFLFLFYRNCDLMPPSRSIERGVRVVTIRRGGLRWT
jgi:hypothetical protein